jgi:hypothetical protein
MLKRIGSDPHSLALLEDAIRSVWCPRVGGDPAAQYVGVVQDFGGVMRYIALHFLKESQRPPAGWSGQRFITSRGYFNGPRWKLREEARRSLRLKRELWRADAAGLDPAEAQIAAEIAVVNAEALRWECVKLTVDEQTGEIVRAATLQNREPSVMRLDRTAKLFAEAKRAEEEGRWLAQRHEGYVEPPETVTCQKAAAPVICASQDNTTGLDLPLLGFAHEDLPLVTLAKRGPPL